MLCLVVTEQKSDFLKETVSISTDKMSRRARASSIAIIFLFALCFGLAPVWRANAQDAPAGELHTAAKVRSLTLQEAGQHLPVRLKGVVTFYDEGLFSRFVQDETAGISLGGMSNMPALTPGQVVEIVGTTSPGEYAPIIVPNSVTVIGERNLPVASPVSVEELVSGQQDSQFVEVVGVVRSVRFEQELGSYLIELVTGGERFTAYLKVLPVARTEELVDATVKVRGVCSTLFTSLRQLFGFRLLIARPGDLVIEKPAVSPSEIPVQSIDSLLQFDPHGVYGHRAKVGGTVIYYQPDVALFIQGEKNGAFAQSRLRTGLHVGDQVEVLGFPAKGEYNPVLQDSIYRKVGSGVEPKPDEINYDEALKGVHDCRLVRIKAKLLERAQRGREQLLILETEGFVFHAFLGEDPDGAGFARLQNGSQVAVTGVCLIERGSNWRAGESWRAQAFHILLRSPEDVVVLKSPSWWTLKKVLWIAGGLGLVTLAAFIWVGVLRRRVRQQTEIIRERLQKEAALKERYEDLFENANDMVFTHDLTGQITSINKAGERLLQRDRASILSCNFIELVAEDQRFAARHWLDQVVRGDESPTVEWDFVTAMGDRVKLEISSRLIEQRGNPVEVEGIARDITERRRLEREILEISHREQRRIGHDLHDGVCQQLAGISYMVGVLAEQLEGKSAPEHSEAERIGNLLNEANMQARNVARGLFPVRLNEHGLIVALEELAVSASNRYRIDCRFVCQTKPPAVDSQVGLHLYYIVQEALLNAVNHGKATSVVVTLAAERDQYKLMVHDNGTGFQPAGKNQGGMGIRIMRYRAKVLGANFELQSNVDHGTQITCVFNPSPGAASRGMTNA